MIVCFRYSNTPPSTGMDYAQHEDILPYSSTDSHPVDNDYFREFLMFDPDKGESCSTEDCVFILQPAFMQSSLSNIKDGK